MTKRVHLPDDSAGLVACRDHGHVYRRDECAGKAPVEGRIPMALHGILRRDEPEQERDHRRNVIDGVEEVFAGVGGTAFLEGRVGGTDQDFHESLNFAGVYRLPVVFLIENNQWAISVPLHKQTASETLAQKALAYGFDGIQVDGNDPLAVYVATKEATEKAKAGGGPTLIEAVTYRLAMHTTADDPKKYRSDEEVQRWEKLDPIPRYQTYLIQRGILSAELIAEIEADVKAKISEAVERYEAVRNVDPLACFDYMYAELPAELVEQRDEFRAALEREGFGKGC